MRFIALVALTMALSGCGGGPLSLLTGGGPNVAANTQAGQTNNQTVGQSSTVNQRFSSDKVGKVTQNAGDIGVSSEKVEKVVVNELDWRLMLLFGLFAGFVIPSPQEIGRWFLGVLRLRRVP